jgi:hypothetical protein
LKKKARDMRYSTQALHDPLPEAAWEVWYEDMFDRECPPSVEVGGQGLVKGLMELWARHLLETVRPNGSEGFSRFHLAWGEKGFAKIVGNWQGATRLRKWIFGVKVYRGGGHTKAGDTRLLEAVGVALAHLILAGKTSQEILAAAAEAIDREEFEARIASFYEPEG